MPHYVLETSEPYLTVIFESQTPYTLGKRFDLDFDNDDQVEFFFELYIMHKNTRAIAIAKNTN